MQKILSKQIEEDFFKLHLPRWRYAFTA